MKRYLLVGLGVSNMAVARDLLELGEKFDLFLDKRDKPLEFGEHNVKIYSDVKDMELTRYDTIIKSPGVPFSHPIIQLGLEGGIAITNEVGYSLSYIKKPLISITGTNGKTTTTSLIEHILNNSQETIAKSVGNIGRSFLEEAKKGEHILVAELSSFQLRDLKNFNPDISIWLNISDAHLDYHKSFEDYLTSKKNICINQSPDKLLIYNEDDINVAEAASMKKGRKKSFSLKNPKANAYFDGACIWVENERWASKEILGMKGLHNIQNIMASILATKEYVSEIQVQSGICSFASVEHRLEKVSYKQGTEVYNDSKSTNITSVKAALSAFEEPVTLMMGGLDRGNGYEGLANEWNKVKTIICFGQSGKKIYKEACKYTEAILEKDLEKAIEVAKEKIDSNGVLLFSPGCASWDQFKSFEERGEFFKGFFTHI